MSLPRKMRPCSGDCGKIMQSYKSTPMCHPCRRLRPSYRFTTCADCGNRMESRQKEGESRCWECSRDRRAACPPCSACDGDMGNSWFYRWLKGKVRLPPVCWACKKAPK